MTVTEVQFNPSTLRVIRNAATGKVQMAVTAEVNNCPYCPALTQTPSKIAVSFRGIEYCANICLGYTWKVLSFNFNINQNWIIPLYDEPNSCGYIQLIPNGVTLRHYAAYPCQGAYIDIDTTVQILVGRWPEYSGISVVCGDFGEIFWAMDYVLAEGKCFGSSDWVPNSFIDCVYPGYHIGKNGEAFIIESCDDAPIWDLATAYIVGDLVRHNESGIYHCYNCILANTNQEPPNSTYWTEIDF